MMYRDHTNCLVFEILVIELRKCPDFLLFSMDW
jgi:hypothetical protein